MINLNSQMTLAHSYANNMNAYISNYIHNSVIYFFEGDAPTELASIPMDIQTNFAKLAEASVAMSQIRANPSLSVPGQTTFDYSNLTNYIATKKHKFVPAMNKWLLSHAVLTLSRTHEGVDKWVENVDPSDTLGSSTDGLMRCQSWEVQELRDVHAMDVLRYSPSQLWYRSDNFNLKLGRYANRYPLVFTYEQAVTVDSMYIALGSNSSSYTSEHYDFEYWDEVNEVWVAMERLSVNQGSTQAQLVNFSQEYTAKKFKMRMSDTGSQDPYLYFVHLCSSTEPTYGTGTADITWAAICLTNATNFYDFPTPRYTQFETESTRFQKDGYPFLFLDVGSPGDNCAITVNKSRGLKAFEEVQILDFNLKFIGNE